VGLPAGPAAAWQLGCTEVPLPSTPWCWYAGKAADRTATAFRNPRPAAPSAVAQPIRPAQAPGPRPQAPGPRPQAQAGRGALLRSPWCSRCCCWACLPPPPWPLARHCQYQSLT
jgi:hypothetical protein